MIKAFALRTVASVFVFLAALSGCQAAVTTTGPSSEVTPTSDLIPPYAPTITVPAELKLTGTLIVTDYHQGSYRLDFATGVLTPIFRPPINTFLSTAVLSPDRRTLAMVYSPPHDEEDPLYGVASLFTVPADGSDEPKNLLDGLHNDHYFYSLSWAPDGRSLYYGRLVSPSPSGTPSTEPSGYFLTRFAFPNDSTQDLLRNVLAVRPTADGKKLFYVSVDPTSTLSNLYVADLDGSHAQPLLPGGNDWIIDSLAVSPDGNTVVYSTASQSVQSSLPEWERLMGVGLAQAHAVPSDLWIMKLGEAPRQLTHLLDSGFVEDFSPDGQYVIFSCSNAIYLIRTDGTGLTPILSVPVYASLQWLP